MKWEDINFYPELINDILMYVCVIALICVISAMLSKWKEKRRLKKELAEYQQRREDEEQEYGQG